MPHLVLDIIQQRKLTDTSPSIYWIITQTVIIPHMPHLGISELGFLIKTSKQLNPNVATLKTLGSFKLTVVPKPQQLQRNPLPVHRFVSFPSVDKLLLIYRQAFSCRAKMDWELWIFPMLQLNKSHYWAGMQSWQQIPTFLGFQSNVQRQQCNWLHFLPSLCRNVVPEPSSIY